MSVGKSEIKVFQKTYTLKPEMVLETEMTSAVNRVLKNSDLVLARVVGIDNLEVSFTFQESIKPIAYYIKKPKFFNGILTKIARILAEFHNGSILIDNSVQKVLLSTKFLAQSNTKNTFLHGDFNCINVQYDLNNDKICIIDWAHSYHIQPPGNYGSLYLDVCWFIRSLFTVNPLYTLFSRNDVNKYAKLFADSYFSKNDSDFDQDEFRRIGMVVYDLFNHSGLETQLRSRIQINYSWKSFRVFLFNYNYE